MRQNNDLVTQAVKDLEAKLRSGEGATVIWPQNADALNKGPEGLLLSAAVSLQCDGCGQDVPFTPEQVEGWFNEGGLIVQSTWDRQHGCGTWAPPIVRVTVSLDELDRIDEWVTLLRERVKPGQDDRRERLRAKLVKALEEARAARPQVSEAEEPGEWNDWRRSYHVSQSNGGGDGPIFEESDGTLTAWAYGPAGEDDSVEVL